MKKFLVTLLCLSLAFFTYSQADLREGRHILNYDVTLPPCTLEGIVIPGAKPLTISANTKFDIRNIVNGEYVIQVSKFTSGTRSADSLNALFYKASNGEDILFKITQVQYTLNAERFTSKGSFVVGAATTLIKIRPGSKQPKSGYNIYSEFGNDFNLGFSAGIKIKPNRRREVSHNLVVGLSFTSIKVTPYTTKKFVDSESTQGCVTISAGYVFEYNKFQVSAFSGIDIMSGEVGRNWIYRNRPWIGLGFGFQIFRGEAETANSPK